MSGGNCVVQFILVLSLILNCVHFLDDCVFGLHEVDLLCALDDPEEGLEELSVLGSVPVLVLANREKQGYHGAHFVVEERHELNVV